MIATTYRLLCRYGFTLQPVSVNLHDAGDIVRVEQLLTDIERCGVRQDAKVTVDGGADMLSIAEVEFGQLLGDACEPLLFQIWPLPQQGKNILTVLLRRFSPIRVCSRIYEAEATAHLCFFTPPTEV